MKNTKLIELLSSLSKEEMRKFNDFLKSPFFNKSKTIIKLHLLIKKDVINNKEINKRHYYETIYKDNKYNDQKLRSIFSDYLKLLEMFLVNTPSLPLYKKKSSLLLNEYAQRNLYKNFNYTYNKLKKELAQNPFKNHVEYKAFIELEECCIIFKEKNIRSNIDQNFIRLRNRVFFYYMYITLKSINASLSYIEIRGADSYFQNILELKDPELQFILKYISDNIHIISQEHRLILSEYNIINMFLTGDSGKTLTFLKKNFNHLNIETLKHLYTSLNAFHSYNINNTNDFKYFHKQHSVNKFFYKINFFASLDYMPATYFFNFIQMCLDNNDVKLAKKFYLKYKQKLEPAYSEDIINFTVSHIFLYEKNYEEAIKNLSKVSLKNHVVYLISRQLISQAYYELKEYEGLYYLIDSTKHFLSRNKKILGTRFRINMLYYNYLTKLLKINDLNSLLKFKTYLQNTKGPNHMPWLLKKIDELESKFSKVKIRSL